MPKIEENEINYRLNEWPKCPHCDYEDDEIWDHNSPEDIAVERVCLACGESFSMRKNVQITYDTFYLSEVEQ